MIDMADDDDAHLRPGRAVRHRGYVCRGYVEWEDHVHGCAHAGRRSEIASDPEPLESIFGLMVERAPRTLRHLGSLQFSQDLLDAGSMGLHREGDVGIAKRAI